MDAVGGPEIVRGVKFEEDEEGEEEAWNTAHVGVDEQVSIG